MVEQILLSPQVKRSVIISNKTSTYMLPHELPNNLTILGNYFIVYRDSLYYTHFKEKTWPHKKKNIRKLGNIREI